MLGNFRQCLTGYARIFLLVLLLLFNDNLLKGFSIDGVPGLRLYSI